MILVDTSVIADVFTKDPEWFPWSSEQIERWGEEGPLYYNPIDVAHLPLLTRDRRRVRTFFPSVRLITP